MTDHWEKIKGALDNIAENSNRIATALDRLVEAYADDEDDEAQVFPFPVSDD